MYCNNCGERMLGDGYSTTIHCPYANEVEYEYNEPDANPVHCTYGVQGADNEAV